MTQLAGFRSSMWTVLFWMRDKSPLCKFSVHFNCSVRFNSLVIWAGSPPGKWLDNCFDFQHRRGCRNHLKIVWEGKREGLDHGEAYGRGWVGLVKHRWDHCQDLEMTENVACLWKGRHRECPSQGSRINRVSGIRANVNLFQITAVVASYWTEDKPVDNNT
jgi:hypothetical protein